MADLSKLGPSLITGAGSLLGGVVGGIGSIISTNSANKANKQIAAENRRWQTKENQLNRDWEEKMWQAQNEYNTPSAMMSRYKAAGLNPYLVGDGSPSVGAAASAGTPSMVGAPNQPNMIPADVSGFGVGISQGASSAMQTYLQASSIDANIANQQAQTARSYAETYASLVDSMGFKGANKVMDVVAPLFSHGDANSPLVRRLQANALRAEAESEMADLNNQLAQRFGFQQKEREMEILQLMPDKVLAEINKLKADELLSRKSVDELVTRMARNLAEALKLGAEANTINQLRTYIVNSAKYESLLLSYQEGESSAEYESNAVIRKNKRTQEYKDKKAETFGTWNEDYNPTLKKVNSFIQTASPFIPSTSFGAFGTYNLNPVPLGPQSIKGFR